MDELEKGSTSWSLPFKKDRWIRCFAHVLNWAVQVALEPLKPIIDNVSLKIIIFKIKFNTDDLYETVEIFAEE